MSSSGADPVGIPSAFGAHHGVLLGASMVLLLGTFQRLFNVKAEEDVKVHCIAAHKLELASHHDSSGISALVIETLQMQIKPKHLPFSMFLVLGVMYVL